MRFRWKQEGPRPWSGRITLDDYDASSATQGFTVKSSVGDISTVTLDIAVLHGMELDLEAVVLIPASTVDLLVAHGWTPPEGAEVRAGAMSLGASKPKEPDLLDALEMKCSCAADARDPMCVVHPGS